MEGLLRVVLEQETLEMRGQQPEGLTGRLRRTLWGLGSRQSSEADAWPTKAW